MTPQSPRVINMYRGINKSMFDPALRASIKRDIRDIHQKFPHLPKEKVENTYFMAAREIRNQARIKTYILFFTKKETVDKLKAEFAH